MAYQFSGVDAFAQCVPKDYLLDIYPSLSNLVNSPTLYGWGGDTYGRLGDNANTDQPVPVQTIAGGSNWKQVAAGYYHNAAIKTDGTLWAWGGQNNGALGDNTTVNKSSPVQVYGGGTNWSYLACGYQTAAIKTDGTLWMWGHNFTGALGDGTTTAKSSPVQTISAGTNWKLVSCSGANTAAIKTDGTLWLWGGNVNGQLGDGTITAKSSPVQTISAGATWKLVSNGQYFTSAIKTDGTLWTWGNNQYGQLGDNSTTHRSSPVQTIAGGTNWKKVSCSLYHTAAIKTDGTLWSFGMGSSGQLGDGTYSNNSSPVQTIAGGSNWKSVAGGGMFTAAIKTDGTLWTWGANGYGQLGTGNTTGRNSPGMTVRSTSNWVSVSCNFFDTFAILDDPSNLSTAPTSLAVSSIVISGLTSPINNNTTYNVTILVTYTNGATSTNASLFTWSTLNGIATVTSVTSSGATLTTGVDSGSESINVYDPTSGYTGVLNFTVYSPKTLWNWGRNIYGQLGDNTIDGKSSPVQTVAGGTNWKNIACGSDHTAVVKSDGTLWTWGWDFYGQLGNNTVSAINSGYSSPIQTITGGTNWKSVACGYGMTASIKTDGTLWLWGGNNYGKLGDNTTANKSSPVQTIAGGTNWMNIACSVDHTAAIKTDGTLWMWGRDNYGQLGDNTTANKSSPVQTTTGGTNWKNVACGGYHTAAVKTDGTLWCWGYDTYGQLGDNSTSHKSSPVQTIAGGTNWKNVACGSNHTVAVKTDGTLWCWGNNMYGGLGDNTKVHKSSPVQTVSSGTNWSKSAPGYGYTAAVKTDGTLWVWGNNSFGMLGIDSTTGTSSPVQTVTGGNTWTDVAANSYQTVALKT